MKALLKKYRPTSPGRRHSLRVDRNGLSKSKVLKACSRGILRRFGRNNRGVITSWKKGGGCARKFRFLGCLKGSFGGIVDSFEYDPNRSAFLVRVYNSGPKTHFYMVAPEGLGVGEFIQRGENVKCSVGNVLPLKRIPLGQMVHCIELEPGKGGVLCRSAGSYGVLMQKDKSFMRIRLRSGEHRLVHEDSYASVGRVSNELHDVQVLGKAGVNRLRGRRPIVRGVAMNPVDHPHGGGEGKSSGGRSSVTPWGKPTKQVARVKKTRPQIFKSRK